MEAGDTPLHTHADALRPGVSLLTSLLLGVLLLLSACDTQSTPSHRVPGSLRWRFQPPGPLVGVPAIANGVIYVGSNDGAFSALDASTGAIRWQVWMCGQECATPAIADGVVYLGFNITPTGGLFSALDASTGAARWKAQISGSQDAAPVVANGVVYIGTSGGVVALDASTGALRWTSRPGSASFSRPVVANGMVYADPEADQSVAALDASTGAVRWQFTAPFATAGEFPAAPAVEQGVVYGAFVHNVAFGNPTSSIYALDGTTGAVRWSVHDSMNAYSAPVVVDGVIYLGAQARAVIALDASTGVTRGRFSANPAWNSTPAVANGVIYVGCSDDGVEALDAETGAQRWRFQTHPAPGSALLPVIANGTVYVSSGDSLYALNATPHAADRKPLSMALLTLTSRDSIHDTDCAYRGIEASRPDPEARQRRDGTPVDPWNPEGCTGLLTAAGAHAQSRCGARKRAMLLKGRYGRDCLGGNGATGAIWAAAEQARCLVPRCAPRPSLRTEQVGKS